MITEKELIELGFEKVSDSNFSIHIGGGKWFLHAFLLSDGYVSLNYGDSFNPFSCKNYTSIWAAFTDIEKLKQLIELLKGDKR